MTTAIEGMCHCSCYNGTHGGARSLGPGKSESMPPCLAEALLSGRFTSSSASDSYTSIVARSSARMAKYWSLAPT